MSIFETLRTRALEAVDAYQTEALGMTLSCAYCVVRHAEHTHVGLALTPQGEGALTTLHSDARSVLEHAQAYEPFGRAAALSVMNALFAHKRSSTPMHYAPDMRVLLAQKILALTDAHSRIVIIGNLRPVVAKLRAQGRHVEVFCRSANNPAEGVYNDIFEYEAVMNADVLLITGAALIGSTVDALVAMSPKASVRILAGFSAGVDPYWLRESGITHVCSVDVKAPILQRLMRNDFEAVFECESYFVAVQETIAP